MNAPKSNARQTVNPLQTTGGQNGNQRTAEHAPRRVGFVSVQPTNVASPVAMTTVSTTAQPRAVTTLQPSSSLTPGQTSTTRTQNLNGSTTTQSVSSTVAERIPPSAQQARRVGFTTLQSSQSVSTAKTTSSHTQASNVNPSTASTSTAEHDTVASTQQPRRVGFVTLQPPRNTSVPQRNLPSNPPNQSTLINPPVASEESEGCTPNIQHPPRRVGFVTLKPPPSSTIPQQNPPTNTTPTNQNGSNHSSEEGGRHTPNTQPPSRRVGFVTIQPPQSSSISQRQSSTGCSTNQSAQSLVTEISSASKATNQDQTVPQTLPISETSNPSPSAITESSTVTAATVQSRKRPPVPLEPKIIIIND